VFPDLELEAGSKKTEQCVRNLRRIEVGAAGSITAALQADAAAWTIPRILLSMQWLNVSGKTISIGAAPSHRHQQRRWQAIWLVQRL